MLSGAILFLLGGIALIGAIVSKSWSDAAVSASIFLAGFLYLGISHICTSLQTTAENAKATAATLERIERAAGTIMTEMHNADTVARLAHEARNETNKALQWIVDKWDDESLVTEQNLEP